MGETELIQDPICESEEMRKIFVGGIAIDSKDDELKTLFEELGVTVAECVIVRKDKEKRSHFGFVTLENSCMVDEVLLKRKELVFNGKNLDVNRAVLKLTLLLVHMRKQKKLFIANLPKTGCTEEQLKKYFEDRHDKKFGCIESVQLIKKKDDEGNKTEENKGFGFVLVSSEDMADKMAIQHATFDFGGRKIELKKSVPTTEIGGRRGKGGYLGAQRGRGGGGYGGPPAFGYGQYGGGYGGDWGAYGGYGDGGYGGYGSYGGFGGPARGGGPRGRGQGRYTPY